MFRYARRYKIFWWGIATLSVVGISFIVLTATVADQSNQTKLVQDFRKLIADSWYFSFVHEIGPFVANGTISGGLISLLSALTTLSLVYLFKIPEIRKITIQILAAGYYENFLHSVIQKVHSQIGRLENSVLIILPGFALVENKVIYWNSFQSYAKKHGFKFVQETTDADFGRNIFTIQRTDKSVVPVFIDMPTTLTNLKKIIELEEHSPVGTVANRRSIQEKFYFLRDQFEEELRTYVTEHDWGNVRFVEGRSLKQFEAEVEQILNEIGQT